MTRYVVDASVAGKWFLHEAQTDGALRLRDAVHDLIAPDLMLAELASLMLKAQRRGIVPVGLIQRAIDDVGRTVMLYRTDGLIADAVEIALRYQRSAYDAVYVALAVREACPLVTADRRLYEAIAASLPGSMMWVEELA